MTDTGIVQFVGSIAIWEFTKWIMPKYNRWFVTLLHGKPHDNCAFCGTLKKEK